jgi:hypothetical protein
MGGAETAAWEASFVNLPKYGTKLNEKDEPVEIEYTVKETGTWPGYVVSYEDEDVEYAVDGGVITNTQSKGTTEIKIRKVLKGRKFKDGDEWTFTLTGNGPMPVDEDGDECTEVTIEPVDGDYESTKASFGEITFTSDDAGKTYTYTITESGDVKNVKNAKPIKFKVKVVLNDDGTLTITRTPDEGEYVFTNTYTTPPPPTGDSNNTILWTAFMVTAALLLLLLAIKRRRGNAKA